MPTTSLLEATSLWLLALKVNISVCTALHLCLKSETKTVLNAVLNWHFSKSGFECFGCAHMPNNNKKNRKLLLNIKFPNFTYYRRNYVLLCLSLPILPLNPSSNTFYSSLLLSIQLVQADGRQSRAEVCSEVSAF